MYIRYTVLSCHLYCVCIFGIPSCFIICTLYAYMVYCPVLSSVLCMYIRYYVPFCHLYSVCIYCVLSLMSSVLCIYIRYYIPSWHLYCVCIFGIPSCFIICTLYVNMVYCPVSSSVLCMYIRYYVPSCHLYCVNVYSVLRHVLSSVSSLKGNDSFIC